MFAIVTVVATLWMLALVVLAMGARTSTGVAERALTSDERIVRPLVLHTGEGLADAA